ncbi:MAG: hypothetical protein HY912_20660 [Desulfomonile tiedjei]|uniref:Uncharacterized protein n=1 Tax=Desulfomonile tiedjei TaxID=2358 RepID=A0A9D6Z8B0_9BACT|nr:hypothetical protein [Desulfomonile tiedjei]
MTIKLYGRILAQKSIGLQFQLHYSGGIFYNPAHGRTMKNKTARKYANFLMGIILTAIATSSIPLFEVEPGCSASQEQTVVKWKDMYWFPCKYSWNGFCIWPIRRKHVTYKVTVNEGTALHDENGRPVAIADGKIRQWSVYDSTGWNDLENNPVEKNRYPDYERIAENEFVVLVETRYRLFHDVESTLRICTRKL